MAYKLQKDHPIAVFDSGMGGISVLRELVRIMPNENYIFLGDSANAPYGTKNKDEVCALTLGHAKDFFDEGAKGIVIACNTATSAAAEAMRRIYPEIPIVGIEPALKPAALCGEHPRVLVMATPMTIREAKFHDLMERCRDKADIIPLACPGLMEYVERGDLDGEDLKEYLEALLQDYRDGRVDAAVLGCTHYPFVQGHIRRILGKQVQIFDGGAGTAREMRRRLEAAGLLTDSEVRGTVEFRNSMPEPWRIELCKRLLEIELPEY